MSHWNNPVIYMSRDTTREVWQLMFGAEPDLMSDLRWGQSQMPVLFDDRMEFGTARIEEDPSTGRAATIAHVVQGVGASG